MAKGFVMADLLTRTQQDAHGRLDKLGEVLPEVKQRTPFQMYMAQASEYARHDPAFAAEFQQALAQYRQLGGE